MEDQMYEDVKIVVNYLKDEEYNLGEENFQSVLLVLTTPSSARNKLLFWLLATFGIFYSAQEQKSFDRGVQSKILQDLSCLGLCKINDVNLIDGSANVQAQLFFWKKVLEMSRRYRGEYSQERNFSADNLLHSLVSSPHYEDSLKNEDLNLLPLDVKLHLKATKQKTSTVDSRIFDLCQEVQLEETKLTTYDVSAENSEPPTEFMSSISALKEQCEAFSVAYKDKLEPWCKSSGARIPSSETGNLVSEMYQEFQKFQKCISLSSSVRENAETLERKIQQLKTEEPLTASTVLESVTAEH